MKTIEPLNQEIMEACHLYVDNLTKPLGSLGRMEEMAIRLSGIFNEVKPAKLPKAVVKRRASRATMKRLWWRRAMAR